MKKDKDIKNNRRKAILFFGFYLVFFIILAISFKNYQNQSIKKDNNQKKEEITIKSLFNHDFDYEFIVNDEDKITKFNGNKNNADYNDYENKYFLNYINLNQLMKKGKVVKMNDAKEYEIENSILNELLETERPMGINRLMEKSTDSNLEITFDLSQYMERDFVITLHYIVKV